MVDTLRFVRPTAVSFDIHIEIMVTLYSMRHAVCGLCSPQLEIGLRKVKTVLAILLFP